MTAIPVERVFQGAGRIYVDDALYGTTVGDHVFRIVPALAAPVLNGAGGMLARTDYHTQLPHAELEVTIAEVSETSMPLIVPGATSSAGTGLDAGKTVIVGPTQTTRRLGTGDYHKWELRVDGPDGGLLELRIPLGVVTSSAEFTAADSENPIGPRLTIQSRIDPDNIESPQWEVLVTEAAGS